MTNFANKENSLQRSRNYFFSSRKEISNSISTVNLYLLHQHISQLMQEQQYLLANINHYKKALSDLKQEISAICEETLKKFKAGIKRAMKSPKNVDRINAIRNLAIRFRRDIGRVNKKTRRNKEIYTIRLARFEAREKNCIEELNQKRRELQDLRDNIYAHSRAKLILQVTSEISELPQNRL